MARTADTTRRANVDEMKPLCPQTLIAPNGVAPVGIAAISNNIVALQGPFELVEERVDHRSGRNVEKYEARCAQIVLRPATLSTSINPASLRSSGATTRQAD